MSLPNNFIRRRQALARFRNSIPFLSLIHDKIYHSLDPYGWYEPYGDIEQARRQLQEKINHYVMTYKIGIYKNIPWEEQLDTNIERAALSREQMKILDMYNSAFIKKRIDFVVYTKPLVVSPQEHPFVRCEPPEELSRREDKSDVDMDEIPFCRTAGMAGGGREGVERVQPAGDGSLCVCGP